jgi:hypothetical protein
MAADLPARRMQLLLKTSVIFVGRILTAISSDAKGIAGEAGGCGHSDAIDAARTLAYDAAGRKFVFFGCMRRSSAAHEVLPSLSMFRRVVSSGRKSVFRAPAASATAG